MKRNGLLTLWFLYLTSSLCFGDIETNGVTELAHRIGIKINEFTRQVTGSSAVEKELGNFSFEFFERNGTTIVKDISLKLQQFFNKKIKSLQNLVFKSETFYTSYQYDPDIKPFPYMDMKNYDKSKYKLEYVDKYKRNVTLEESGVQIPTDIYDQDPEILNTIKWTDYLNEIFINNTKEDPDMKWQYFGSKTGVFRTYPAKEWNIGPKNIDLYDARKRPWYIHGSSSPKSMIIIIDSSGSMFGRPLLIARLAVGELIDTLSENDFFNIIWFNNVVHYLSCDEKFVQATPQNKEFFKNKLRDLVANSVASWSKAYTAAFELFEKDSGADCQRVITVFTDGPTERSTDVFNKYNSDKKVRVFTYAVGPPAHSIEALKSIACENKGFFYRIPDVGSVRDIIKGYVVVLSRPMAENTTHLPTWSSVYLDISGLGMMITGTLSVSHEANNTGVSEILGVVGTDVPLNDLDSLIDHSQFGASGYFFFINNNGHIVEHPQLKTTIGYLEVPPAVYVSDVEFPWNINSTKPLQLRKNMLKIAPMAVGTMAFEVALFSDDLFRRVQRKTMKYFFTTIEETPFRVAIAAPKLGVNIVSNPGNPEMNETIINYLTEYWKNNSPNGETEVFLKLFNGETRYSSAYSHPAEVPEKGIMGRMEDYNNDITFLTVPFQQGRNVTSEQIVTGYKKLKSNISGEIVNLGVVGFNMNHWSFTEEYFFGNSVTESNLCNRNGLSEDEGYYCYVIDENAFVLSANILHQNFSGRFFGQVDSEIMTQLVKGQNSTIGNPIYERVVQKDYQGLCTDATDDSSSARFLQPWFSLTSYIKWSATKFAWFLVQMNLYSLFFDKQLYSSAETTEITKSTNRSCIMSITAYVANISKGNVTSQGRAYCGGCYENEAECQRPFYISGIFKTNLFLVVVSASRGPCLSKKYPPYLGIPGEPKEFVLSSEEELNYVCTKDEYRKGVGRCYISNNPETDFPCGSGSLTRASSFLLVLCASILYYW